MNQRKFSGSEIETWNGFEISLYIYVREEEKCVVFYESWQKCVRGWKSGTLKDKSAYPFMANLQSKEKQREKIRKKKK